MQEIKVTKKIIANLEKCYSIAPLRYQDKNYILVAAEKQDACYLFDLDGEQVDIVWEGPGGVMSMVQIPGSDGCFLATQKFYSPNDSKEAKIVIVTPAAKGRWEVRTLVEVPHVHRFDIIKRDGRMFLLVCTLKSGHEHKDDWSMPGKVYAAKLPDELSEYDQNHQLKLQVIKEQMLKNHGYFKDIMSGIETAVVTSENGVFRFTPPPAGESSWEVEKLLDRPTSDAVLVDMDGDGKKELCTLEPFHGENICIYKERKGILKKGYDYPEKAEFAHAIYGGELCGQPAFVVGHRQGKRNLIVIRYDAAIKEYVSQIIDENCGSANVYHYIHDGKDVIIATNREVNEIAMYTLEK